VSCGYSSSVFTTKLTECHKLLRKSTDSSPCTDDKYQNLIHKKWTFPTLHVSNPQIPRLHLYDCHLSCLLDFSPRLIFKAVLYSCAFLVCPIRAIYVAQTHTRLTVLIISPTRLKIPVKIKGHGQRLYRSYTLENSRLLIMFIDKISEGFLPYYGKYCWSWIELNYQVCVLRFTVAVFTSLCFRCLYN